MKKLILIALSLILPAIALAIEPNSFKKSYQWGERDIANCISANEGVYSGKPRSFISRDARAWAPRLCPSADVESFVAGFYQAYVDNGKVLDDPVFRTVAPSPSPITTSGPNQFQMGGGRRIEDTGSTGREGESGYKGWYGERGGAVAPTPSPSTSTDDSLLDADIMTQGQNSGKSFAKRHSKEEKATSDQIREFAGKFADREGYTDEGTARNSFIEGWIDGYYDGAGVR